MKSAAAVNRADRRGALPLRFPAQNRRISLCACGAFPTMPVILLAWEVLPAIRRRQSRTPPSYLQFWRSPIDERTHHPRRGRTQSLVGRSSAPAIGGTLRKTASTCLPSHGRRPVDSLRPVRAAAEGPYGTTVAHGFLTLSLCIAMTQSAFRVEGVKMIINTGLNRVRSRRR